ncbi:hypothetical protein GCM10007416_07650 [Kroppenstedtia guangzhouensis]|uniref:Uncharacterized protein n=1 Tax=Kroppenstedtia guangzhouensis TaxID=1274356 RepID=A0ABQ1G5U2_9BACL|nr:hypothetical protein [Kroppenstedtia guangzhouensis]GGA37206.1 hypothetical protein GCM10007416_07650 [Kroppenstedtia guangzhouensis]
MNYVQPQVRFNKEVQVNEAIDWTVVAIAAIIAIGGYAAYCASKGGDFYSKIDIDDKTVEVGCKM